MRKASSFLLFCSIFLTALPLATQLATQFATQLAAQTPREGQSASEDARSVYRQGEEALRADEPYEAIDYFRESLRINPDYLEPLHGLAEVFFRLGEYQEAEEYIEKAVSKARSNSRVAALQGRIYTGLGDFDRAAEIFSSILRREPNNLQGQFGMAELEVARGRSKNALEVYLGALRSNPQNRRGLLSAAILYEARNNFDDARELIKTAVRYHPDDSQVHAIAASHYLNSKEYSSAQNHAEAALKQDPDNPEALAVLIELFFRRDMYEDAVPVIEKSLGTREDVLHWYALGKARAEMSRMEPALRAFTAALRMRPDDEVTRIVMEDALLSQLSGDAEARVEAGDKRFENARRYERNNRMELARQEYRRGLEISPYDTAGRTKYAETFKKSEDYGKYLSLLKIVEEEGDADRDLLDEIEIYESVNEENIGERWGVDQFALDRDRYKIALFADTDRSVMLHTESELPLTKYFRTLLHGYEHLEVVHAGTGDSYSDFFRKAREQEADYFAVLSFHEEESSFTLKGSVYHGKTGTQLTTVEAFRTGNNRVAEASVRAAKNLQSLLPVRGRIYRREGNRVLLDLGSFHSLEPEDELMVIRAEDIELKSRSFGWDYSKGKLLGEVRVTETEELVSEGELNTSGFFDLVNPRDVVFSPRAGEADGENTENSGENGVSRIESDTGRDVNSSTTYKSLLGIR
ncbi:MAG: tetratricopeptide repeat protein [Spirochaetaceae bacterium]